MNNNDIKKEIDKIKIIDINNIDYLESLCENIQFDNKSQGLINSLFKILEKNPDFDFGMPGFIVHTLEGFYKKGLEKELIESLLRSPNFYTLWMINRILNSENREQDIDKYLNILREITKQTKDNHIKNQVDYILEIQQ